MVLGLLALQGAIGGVQWALELPGEIVWVHVAVATCNWLAMLWTVASAGPPRAAGRTVLRSAGRGAPRATAAAGSV